MYLEKVNIKVIGTKYGPNDKEKKGAVLEEGKGGEGRTSKELNKFLENLQEDGGHRFCGEAVCNITIDTTREY